MKEATSMMGLLGPAMQNMGGMGDMMSMFGGMGMGGKKKNISQYQQRGKVITDADMLKHSSRK